MILSQTMMVLYTILKNPGVNCLELAVKIGEKYDKNDQRVNFMFLEETDEKSHLMFLVKSIYCIRIKDSRFYYDETLLPAGNDDMTDRFVHSFLIDYEKKLKEGREQNEQYGENIIRKT